MSFNNPPLQGKPPANALGLQSVQQIEREARSNQIVPSDDIMVRRTTKGTLLSLRKKSSGGVGAHDHASNVTQYGPCLVTAQIVSFSAGGLAFHVEWPRDPSLPAIQAAGGLATKGGHQATVLAPPISNLKMQHKNWNEPWPDMGEFWASTYRVTGPPRRFWPKASDNRITWPGLPKTRSTGGQWELEGFGTIPPPIGTYVSLYNMVQVLLFPAGYGGVHYVDENDNDLVAGGFLYPFDSYSWNWRP